MEKPGRYLSELTLKIIYRVGFWLKIYFKFEGFVKKKKKTEFFFLCGNGHII